MADRKMVMKKKKQREVSLIIGLVVGILADGYFRHISEN